jgi:hypothetical protein
LLGAAFDVWLLDRFVLFGSSRGILIGCLGFYLAAGFVFKFVSWFGCLLGYRIFYVGFVTDLVCSFCSFGFVFSVFVWFTGC